MSDAAKFEEWALVEIMGRQKIVGKVTETTLAGGAFLRVDVPDVVTEAVKFTRFYAPGSIYCISPISKEVAFAMIPRMDAAPVQRWELPALAEKVSPVGASDHSANEEDGDETDVIF